MKKLSLLVALMVAGGISSSMAYDMPTDDQIAQVVANHAELNNLLVGASPEEAAAVVSKAIENVKGSTLPLASQQQAAAMLYTRGLLLSGENAPAFAGSLAGKLDQTLVPPIIAATAIAVGNTEGPVFNAIAQAVPGVDVAAIAADPISVLGADNVALVQALVIEVRGVAAPVIPPPATAPMNLVPPIVPEGDGGGTPAAPPVGSSYQSQ